MKKILGLNFGRVNGNCRKFLNAAMDAAKKEAENKGEEIEFEIVNAMKLKIAHCIGCGYCSRKLQDGKSMISCVQKDDYEGLSDKVLAADGIILAAPVYVLGPTGQLKNFIDRFGPAHDKAYMLFENALREDTPGDVPLPKDCLKRHLVSYISVGGATTQNWVSYGLPGMNLFGMSLNMKVVDQLDAYGSYVPDRQKMLLAQSEQMGRRMVDSLDKKTSEITWESDPGVCPVCHCKEVTMLGHNKVSCPICGSYGELKEVDGEIKAVFTQKEQDRSRLKFTGVMEHQVELNRRDRYPKFDEYVARFRAMQDEM